MKTYLVGGFVRDTLLGLEPKDKDYVIVGANEDDVKEMLAQGFQQVGADFPVFLHPETGDEYALARIERKVGVGYNGFEAFTSPDLTLEDDLRRRDLTIGAMAMDLETGEIIDFFGGKSDLENGIIRHVSPAFAEDPLRVLRAARFAARYNFKIDPDTQVLMKQLVDQGDLDHLTRERIWVEIEKMLSEKDAHVGIKVLLDIGALQRLFGWNIAFHIPTMMQHTERLEGFRNLDVIGKFCWFSFGSAWTNDEMQAMKIPRHFQQAHSMFDKVLTKFDKLLITFPKEMMEFLDLTSALKTNHVFETIKSALAISVSTNADARFAQFDLAKTAALSVDCAAIASKFKDGKLIADAIHKARIEAIEHVLWVNFISDILKCKLKNS